MLIILYYLINKYKYFLITSFILSIGAAVFDFFLISNMLVYDLTLKETYGLILFLAASIILKTLSSYINLNLAKVAAVEETKSILNSLTHRAKKIDNQTRASSETMIAYKLNDIIASLMAVLEGIKGFMIIVGLVILSVLQLVKQSSSNDTLYLACIIFILVIVVTVVIRRLIYWGGQANYWLNELSKKLNFIYTNQIELFTHKGDYIIQSVLFAQKKLRNYQFYIQIFSQNFKNFVELFGLFIFMIALFLGYASHVGLIVTLAALQRFMPNIQAIFHSMFALGVTKSALLEFAQLKNHQSFIEEIPSISVKRLEKFQYWSKNTVDKLNVNRHHSFQRGHIQRLKGPSGAGKSTYLWNLTGSIGKNGTITVNNESFDCYTMDSVEFFDNNMKIYGSTYQDYFRTADADLIRNLLLDLLLPENIVFDILNPKNNFSMTCETLSEGEYQRVKLAKSLLSQADVIILDEPFSALDKKTSQHAEQLVKRYTKKCFCILVDHGAVDENIST